MAPVEAGMDLDVSSMLNLERLPRTPLKVAHEIDKGLPVAHHSGKYHKGHTGLISTTPDCLVGIV